MLTVNECRITCEYMSDEIHLDSTIKTHEEPQFFEASYPVWIRVPSRGKRCFWTGLTKNAIYELILPRRSNGGEPRVKSILLKLTGKRGMRLIYLESLLSYLEEQSVKQNRKFYKTINKEKNDR